jgi:hypothetical protein
MPEARISDDGRLFMPRAGLACARGPVQAVVALAGLPLSAAAALCVLVPLPGIGGAGGPREPADRAAAG